MEPAQTQPTRLVPFLGMVGVQIVVIAALSFLCMGFYSLFDSGTQSVVRGVNASKESMSAQGPAGSGQNAASRSSNDDAEEDEDSANEEESEDTADDESAEDGTAAENEASGEGESEEDEASTSPPSDGQPSDDA